MGAACSLFHLGSPGEALPPDPDAVTVIVHNNLTPPAPLTVFIITEGGSTERLGQVGGASTERFTSRVPPAGSARLYARGGGGERTSRSVALRLGQILEWDLFANFISERFGGG